MIELKILKYLLDINNYNKYRIYITINNNKEIESLYSILDTMMVSYNRDLTLEEFRGTAVAKDSSLAFLIEQMESLPVAEEVVADVVKEMMHRSFAHQHALLAIEVSQGKKPIIDLIDNLNKVEDKKDVESIEFVSDDAEDIYGKDEERDGGLQFRLESLRESLGGLYQGDFGFIFARPESGKTTFLASEVTHFAEQVTQPVLWFNNEERSEKVKSRLHSAALGLTKQEIMEDPVGKVKKYMDITKGNIKLIDQSGEKLHKSWVERIVKELNPSLIVFDQLDKITGFGKEDREDLKLGAAYIWARGLAKQYCPIIGVSQADVSAEGKQWLHMDNVANAKTAKQAEADYIIGIGKSHKLGLEHIRYLHLSKNKLTGNHAKMEVIIDAPTARYEDI